MKKQIEAHAVKAIGLMRRSGKPDWLKQIVASFKPESPESTAVVQQGMSSSDLVSSSATLTSPVSAPA